MVTLFGVLVLSIGLVRLIFMTGSAGAVPPMKEEALAGVTQKWDKNLPTTSLFTVLTASNNQAVRDLSLLADFVPAVFSGVLGYRFWSATTVAGIYTQA